MKNTIINIKNKKNTEKITMLTAYDYSTAKLVDEAGIDCILVGDSLGMSMLGYPDTLSVTMEDMIHHSRAVCRGTKDALVVTDMPFMSYQTSIYDAVVNAGRLVKEGMAQSVKLEGGIEMADRIKAIVEASIPVMGHLGLTPQSSNTMGGFRVQGRDMRAAQKLFNDALAVQKAGAFALVLECVPALLATLLTQRLAIPTIGIGAGPGCDGQVLVYQDLLGINLDFKPKFVKKFAPVGQAILEAFKEFAKETREGNFPGQEHSFQIDPEIIAEIEKM
jgi:3-methyl-2-oxobutanoate hydroxymethyltransferase